MDNKIKILDVAYHRNGVCGAGFTVVIFEEEGRTMLATIFEAKGHCAVYDIEKLAKKDIAFGMGNSWSGYVYEEKLRIPAQKFLDEKWKKAGI